MATGTRSFSVVRHLLLEERYGCEHAVVGEEQCVGIGGRFGNAVGGDHTGRSGSVVHHYGLSPEFGELLGENARGDVDRTARRVLNDDTHAAFGEVALRHTCWCD